MSATHTNRALSQPKAVERSKPLWVFAFSALAPVLVFAVVFATEKSFEPALICLLGTVAFVPVVATSILATKQFDPFHPLNLVALSVFFGATGRSIYLVYSNSKDALFILDNRPMESILPGAIIIAIGAICICIGYYTTRKIRYPIENAKFAKLGFSSGRLKFLAILVCLITAVVTVDMLRRTGFSGFHSIDDLSQKRKATIDSANAAQGIAALGYHKMLGTLLPRITCLFLTSICLIKSNRWLVPYAIICGLLACVMPFLTSSRIEVVFLFLMVLAIVNCYKQIPFRNLVLGAACIMAILLGMKALRQGEAKRNHNSTLVSRVTDTLFGNRNFCGVTKTTHIYEGVPDRLGMKYGSTLLLWMVAPVPREIWPAKPQISLGYEVTEQLYDRDILKGGGTPPGFMGEMMMNFGVAGVPFGCLALGGILGVFYATFRPVIGSSVLLRCLYAGLLIPLGFHLITGEVSRTMIGLLSFLGLYFAVLLLCGTRR